MFDYRRIELVIASVFSFLFAERNTSNRSFSTISTMLYSYREKEKWQKIRSVPFLSFALYFPLLDFPFTRS